MFFWFSGGGNASFSSPPFASKKTPEDRRDFPRHAAQTCVSADIQGEKNGPNNLCESHAGSPVAHEGCMAGTINFPRCRAASASAYPELNQSLR
jgi:hypothetical protein